MATRSPATPGTLGTFGGVFTPSILTILGIILFLRMGYVVGSAGLLLALAMVLLANAISILTSLSLSAIATNLRVRGGGDYFVISRTLGVEYGGALGVVLFLAQSVSIAFYAIGFGEAVATLTGGPGWLPQAIAAAAIAALFVLAWLGSDWATRFQFIVMVVLAAAIVSFFVGGIGAFDELTLRSNVEPSLQADGTQLSFWAIFAIFFPAVTGFTQGVSMSGDLRDPSRSLPTGTFLAVGLSMVIYIGVVVVFAGALPGSELVIDLSAMRRVAAVPGLIDAGVIAATLSSALASFMGAPRILQALARDKIFPLLNPFAKGVGPTANPRRGVLLSLAIAAATVALGDLNVIAPIVSMFFLISYGLLNYATYFEARANSPSFRPRFRWFHRRLSLLGAVACGGVMVMIEPTAAIVSVVILIAIFVYVRSSVMVDRWSDSERSLRLQRVRDDLLAISSELGHPRDWRPVILAFSEHPARRERLLRFASWVEGRSGFTTVVQIVEGSGPTARRTRAEADKALRRDVARHELSAFARVVVSDQPEAVLPTLIQGHGLGRIFPNIVLFNWLEKDTATPERLRTAAASLRSAVRFGCNVMLLSSTAEAFEQIDDTPSERRRMDVWYRENTTGKLMLLLAYLTTRSEGWEEARIRLLVPRKKDVDDATLLAEIRRMLDDVRISAEPVLVDTCDARSLMQQSLDATLTFLPFRSTSDGPTATWGGALAPVLEPLGATALVLAAEDIALESEPDGGQHAEIASAVDAAAEAKKAVERLEKEVADATVAAGEAQHAVHEGERSHADDLDDRREAVERAERELEQTTRKLAKARVKAEDADKAAHVATGGEAEDEPDTPSDGSD